LFAFFLVDSDTNFTLESEPSLFFILATLFSLQYVKYCQEGKLPCPPDFNC
jgi:hypothetical protein